MTKSTDAGLAVFEEWLQSELGKTAKSWQVETLAAQRFPGLPSMTTYDLLLGALSTVREPKRGE